jgi:hypothetical protein
MLVRLGFAHPHSLLGFALWHCCADLLRSHLWCLIARHSHLMARVKVIMSYKASVQLHRLMAKCALH